MKRVFIALTHTLETSDWTRRHDADEVPDATPYGLHHLADHGFDVEFSTAATHPPRFRSRVGVKVTDTIHHRTDGLEFVPIGTHRRRLRTGAADAVFCYDERTGIPAALQPGADRAPVVSGIAWLARRTETSTLHRWAAQRALPRTDALFTQCAPMVDVLAHEWQVPRARLHFVPLGIDTDFFSTQPFPDPAAPAVISSAGEDRFRDHAQLIDAVRAIRSRRHPSTRLELATGLPVDLPAEWGTLYTERMNGRMRDVYGRSTVVAVALKPTDTGSGLTVVLEAMASGRPVVVTGNPGVSDYVAHGETGLLVPPNDPDAFAGALEALLDDPDRAREMGSRAAQVVRREFSSKQMSGHIAHILHAVT